MHLNLDLRESDAPSIAAALDRTNKNLTALRSETGGDEAERLRQIGNQKAVARSFERLLKLSRKPDILDAEILEG